MEARGVPLGACQGAGTVNTTTGDRRGLRPEEGPARPPGPTASSATTTTMENYLHRLLSRFISSTSCWSFLCALRYFNMGSISTQDSIYFYFKQNKGKYSEVIWLITFYNISRIKKKKKKTIGRGTLSQYFTWAPIFYLWIVGWNLTRAFYIYPQTEYL
jgi:hypothetical protein